MEKLPFWRRPNLYCWNGYAYSYGYGETGIIAVYQTSADGCPTSTLAEMPYLPADGDNVVTWGLPVTGPVALTFGHPNGISDGPGYTWASDHPDAGPTGPPACGTCFPADRETHSFFYGIDVTSPCPGSPLFDGVCNAEWYGWSAAFSSPVSVESSGWAGIKSMYR